MFYDEITEAQAALIANAPMFFLASAAPGLEDGPDGSGPVNVSPRGGAPLHVLTPHRVAFVDYRGSGNETARHLSRKGATTVMICSFEPDNAAIVRLYGTAKATPIAESDLAERLLADRVASPGSVRQIITIDVRKTQTSCGYSVPVMEFVRDRQVADRGRAYK